MTFAAETDAAAGRLRLTDDCRMADLPVLADAIAGLREAAPRELQVDLTHAGEFDIGPAWLLRTALERARAEGRSERIEGQPPGHFAFFDELPDPGAGAAAESRPDSWLIRFGRAIDYRVGNSITSLGFGGRTLVTAARVSTSLRRLRLPSIVRHAYETGVQAIPVVAVIAFLIAIILAYIGAQQLRQFGAEIFTVDLVAIGVLRELGVLLTAIMVAGRTGSAYAAELGVMQLNDEVDALESLGLDPFEVLVLPRVLGLVIAMPLLTVVADAMGLAGGALLTTLLIDLPWAQYLARLDSAISDTTFWAGMIKAPVFGVLIALTGTMRGLQVRESSRELGRLTTIAVVQSIFLVIFADALFAIFFLEIDF
jgi:phospholipid/cholesterol/gamma-HCH transport system permease protein